MSKNRFGKFWNFDPWRLQFWPEPKNDRSDFEMIFPRAFRTLPFVFLYGDQEPRSWGGRSNAPPPPAGGGKSRGPAGRGLIALRMLNIAAGYSYNTLSCLELNREHSGECFRLLDTYLRRYERVKPKNVIFSRKFDLWPDLTRSNVDLGLKTICAIARSRRDASNVFREALRPPGADRQGSYPPDPRPSALWEMHWPGEG